MIMDKNRLRYLITIWKQKKATLSERNELNVWYTGFDQDTGYTEQLSEVEQLEVRDQIWSGFEQKHLSKAWWQRPDYRAVAAAAGRLRGLPRRLQRQRSGGAGEVQIPQPNTDARRRGRTRRADREVPRSGHQPVAGACAGF